MCDAREEITPKLSLALAHPKGKRLENAKLSWKQANQYTHMFDKTESKQKKKNTGIEK